MDNISIKRLSDGVKNYILLTKQTLNIGTQSSLQKEVYRANTYQNIAGVAILALDKIDLKSRTTTKINVVDDKEIKP